ncbi:TRIC cation channel family protein [Leucobacter sp. UCMA 4100]|uniref:trimeric intracellular cation channel family protein n=1 Tax=Leucobacter sp. UCMA 4100 TaxID=2810534 RepID=UPI0022EA93EA|nr:TRIC cation channel family protein [Leucobacter sp. UCMA 4100]MDA3146340.1 TRIC cation channel family protein [Leucobacter sp. UCMA 4100]
MTATSEIVFEALWIFGILAFAISGGLVGVRRNLDLLGILVVGTATGIGGGIIRDLIIGVQPPVAFVHWPYWGTAIAGSLFVFFFHPGLARIRRAEIISDAFGLGVFAAYGAAVGVTEGFDPLTSVFIGTVAAIGGGVIRDVLVNDIPGVLTRELYAVSAILGATVAMTITWFTGYLVTASVVGGILATGLRLTSYKMGWHLPKPKMK